jgi:hypothetical protein
MKRRKQKMNYQDETERDIAAAVKIAQQIQEMMCGTWDNPTMMLAIALMIGSAYAGTAMAEADVVQNLEALCNNVMAIFQQQRRDADDGACGKHLN